MQEESSPFSEFQVLSELFREHLDSVRGDVTQLVTLSESEEPTDERVLLENARATALSVTRLVELIEERFEFQNDAESEQSAKALSEAAAKLRVAVLDVLKASKLKFENPLDFVRSQSLTESAATARKATDNVEELFLCLRRQIEGDKQPEDLTQSSPPVLVTLEEREAETVLPEALNHIAALEDSIAVLYNVVLQEHSSSEPVEAAMKIAVSATKLVLESVSFECSDLLQALHATLESARSYTDASDTNELTRVASVTADVMRRLRQKTKGIQEAATASASQMRAAMPQVALLPATTVAELASRIVEAVKANEASQETVAKMIDSFLLRSRRAEFQSASESGSSSNMLMAQSRGRSVTVKSKSGARRLRATTAAVEVAMMLASPRHSETDNVDAAARAAEKEQLERYMGVSNLSQWEKLLNGESGDLLHLGGIIGDIHIVGGGDLSTDKLEKDASASIIACNTAAISRRAITRTQMEATIDRFVGTLGGSLLSMRNSLGDAFPIAAEELLVSSLQHMASFDMTTGKPDEYMLADASQQTFSALLGRLFRCSHTVRALSIHFTSTICSKTSVGTPVAVLQASASSSALVDALEALHQIVLTSRALSELDSSASSRSIDEEYHGIDLWTELTVMRGSSDASLRKVSATWSPPLSPTPTSSRPSPRSPSRFLSRLFRPESQSGGTSDSNRDGSPRVPSSGSSNTFDESDDEDSESVALLVHGTLNQLIAASTPASDQCNVNELAAYQRCLLATHQSFSSSAVVLCKLLERYRVPDRFSAQSKSCIRNNVASVLRHWLLTQPLDWSDQMLALLQTFATTETDEETLSRELSRMLESLARNRRNRKAVFETPPTECGPVGAGTTPVELILRASSEEIARQLTLIDFRLFSTVQMPELQGQSWSKAKKQHSAPNVTALISRLNTISYWIPTVVLMHNKVEDRSRALETFVEIACCLRSHNNFHTLMGVIAGLNMAAVSQSRLKASWAGVSESLLADFSHLETLMSPSGSFKQYRLALKNAPLPKIPYMGSVCGDLTFLDEGNPDMLDGLINFEKRLDIFRTLEDLAQFQKTGYPWPTVEPFHSLLYALAGFSDRQLYSLSLELEPRNAKQ